VLAKKVFLLRVQKARVQGIFFQHPPTRAAEGCERERDKSAEGWGSKSKESGEVVCH